jgi:hypothetical protein
MISVFGGKADVDQAHRSRPLMTQIGRSPAQSLAPVEHVGGSCTTLTTPAMAYGTLASISGCNTTLSWAVASLRVPMHTAGFSPRFTATCKTFAGI